MRAALVTVLAVAALGPAAAAQADPPPPGSTWTQATITEPDGTKLHADVLRPSDLPADAKTPVIVSVGPYFNHSGQTGPAGPVEGTPYDPTGAAGPSSRFYDFVNGAHLMQRGYTYVMVDLRGFGGSSGCLDWGGPVDQARRLQGHRTLHGARRDHRRGHRPLVRAARSTGRVQLMS